MLSGFNLLFVATVYTLAVFAGGFFFAKRNLNKVLEATKAVTEIAKNTVDTINKIKQENKNVS